MIRPKRHRPAKQTQWSDAAWLRHELQTERARHAALIASLPARDQAVADAVAAKVTQHAAQAGADAAVAHLAERGLLRQEPAVVANVRRIVRDDQGQIAEIIERAEQVEP